jgi:Xaa-Pro dipeptidase
MTVKLPLLPPAITEAERLVRLDALRHLAEEAGCRSVLLGSTTSLRYFTGLAWHPSERFTGAVIHPDGVDLICPRFEFDKVVGSVGIECAVFCWEEDQSPYSLIADRTPSGRLAIDDQLPLLMYLKLRGAISEKRLTDAGPIINRLRRCKTASEIALMQHAKTITLEVQRRAHAQLREGQRASEVARFIDDQHRALGGNGNTFCIVSFAEDTSLPHGGEGDRALNGGDIVLIDTGTQIDGYNSDITRTYAFGEAQADVRSVWDAEKEAQAAAFEAAQLGRPCESADNAARAVLARHGYGPDYRLPGLPHRTGHGIGLDVHEAPNLCRGDVTPLEPGMCFSNEPMIVIPGRFGVRHEDHFYMTESGPRWFTEPAHSLDEPFANAPVFA